MPACVSSVRCIGWLALLVLAWPFGLSAEPLQVAVVGGLQLSGVWPRLALRASQATGVELQTRAAAPKEQVVPLFRRGQVDLLLIHGGDEALQLQAQGFAQPLRVWAYNEHVLVGPLADPAGVASAASAAQAFQRIQATQQPFIAFRDTGSHALVQALWRRLGIQADPAWVRLDVTQRPQDILQQAAEQQAYVLVGHIPLAFGKLQGAGLRALFKGDPQLRRPYVLILPGPRHPAGPRARADAQRLADYLLSANGQADLQAADREAGGPWIFPF